MCIHSNYVYILDVHIVVWVVYSYICIHAYLDDVAKGEAILHIIMQVQEDGILRWDSLKKTKNT